MSVPYSGRKVFLNLLATLAGSAASVATLSVCMYLLGPVGVMTRGIFAFAVNLVETAGTILDLGFTNAHVKRVSEGMDLGRCVGTFLAIRIVQAAILTAGVVPFLLSGGLYAAVSGQPEGSLAVRVALGAALAAYVLNQIADVWRHTYAAQREVVHQRFPIVVGGWMQLPAAALACGLFGIVPVSEWTVAWWCAATVVTPVLALGYYLLWVKPLPVSMPDRATLKSYWRFAAPMSLSSLFLPIQLNADKWLLTRWMGYEAVGLYDLCQRMVQALDRRILAQIGSLVLSKVSELHAKARIEEIRHLAASAERYLAFLAVPICAWMAAVPGEILGALYGPGKEGGAVAFGLLSIVALSASLNRPYAQVVTGMDRPAFMMWLGFAMAFVGLSLKVLLIPSALRGVALPGWGVTGAAVATLAAALFGTGLNRWYAQRLCGGGGSASLLRHLAAGALGWALARSAADALPWGWRLPASAGVCIAAYAAALLAWREIRREDLDFVRDAVSPRKAAADLKDKLKR